MKGRGPAQWFRIGPTGREFVPGFESQGCASLCSGLFSTPLSGMRHGHRLAWTAKRGLSGSRRRWCNCPVPGGLGTSLSRPRCYAGRKSAELTRCANESDWKDSLAGFDAVRLELRRGSTAGKGPCLRRRTTDICHQRAQYLQRPAGAGPGRCVSGVVRGGHAACAPGSRRSVDADWRKAVGHTAADRYSLPFPRV